MNGLMGNLSAMSAGKKILLAICVIASMAITLLVAQSSKTPDMALLYAGLEGRSAGAVVAQLDQMGVPTEIRGSAVYVNRADRDRVRMVLAADGLPASGQQGYELLDGLSGFGTTAEMFDAAYWRAKEGELARTLLATPDIAQARVHIGTPRRRSFSTTRMVPTASVTLTGSGGPVSRASAMSARYLVSLAVPGLSAEQVAVIDANNGVILRPGDEEGGFGSFGDADRARQMKAEIAAILAARVGDGRARVSVNIETTRESETVSRRIIDPESKTLRESKITEMAETGNDSSRAVTVASNLPDGDADGGKRSSSRDENRRTDIFDYTETREEVLRPAGTIKRISVAVLLDGIRTVAGDGTESTDVRPPEELAKLEKLVKSAIGFDEERGDIVTVESISFAEMPSLGTLATPAPLPGFVETNMMQLVQMGVLGLVALILGLFVVRPVMLANQRPQNPRLEGQDAALGAIDITPKPQDEAAMAREEARKAERDMPAAPAAKPNALELLRSAVDSRNDESVNVIRGWLEKDIALEQAR